MLRISSGRFTDPCEGVSVFSDMMKQQYFLKSLETKYTCVMKVFLVFFFNRGDGGVIDGKRKEKVDQKRICLIYCSRCNLETSCFVLFFVLLINNERVHTSPGPWAVSLLRSRLKSKTQMETLQSSQSLSAPDCFLRRVA